MAKLPKNYMMFQKRYPELVKMHEKVGMLAKEAGPIDSKTSNLIQLSASVALRSEGSVHSHVRRALEAGATKEEIYHTIALLVTTVGFPAAAAAFSWVNDIIGKKR